MIPNERLQGLLDDADIVCYRGEDGEDIDFECIAQELLTLRKEKKELEQKYKNATTYCEKHTDFEGYCCVVCLLEDRDNLRREKQLLIENSERLAGELMWCSGSLDFSPEGIAHEGFINGVVPALDKHEALMKQVKGE